MSKSTRLCLTLPPETYETVRRLADLQGVSMASIIRDFMGEVLPVLEKICDALEVAKKASIVARESMLSAAVHAEEELRPIAEMAKAQFNLFAGELNALVKATAPGAGEAVARAARRRSSTARASGSRKAPNSVITGATTSQQGRGKSGTSEAGRGFPVKLDSGRISSNRHAKSVSKRGK